MLTHLGRRGMKAVVASISHQNIKISVDLGFEGHDIFVRVNLQGRRPKFSLSSFINNSDFLLFFCKPDCWNYTSETIMHIKSHYENPKWKVVPSNLTWYFKKQKQACVNERLRYSELSSNKTQTGWLVEMEQFVLLHQFNKPTLKAIQDNESISLSLKMVMRI